MNGNKKKWPRLVAAAAVITMVAIGFGLRASSAGATGVGETPANPVVVANVDDVPEGAVEDEVSTYVTDNTCDTTRSWVLVTPGSDAVLEWGVQERTRQVVSHSHVEWMWQKQVRETTYKYEVGKFYDEDVYDYTRYSWNPGRHDDANTPPPFPSPKWQRDNKPYNGTDPVGEAFRAGGGESWFYWDKELEHAAGDQYTQAGTIWVTDLDAPFTWGGYTYDYVGDTRVVNGVRFRTQQIGDAVSTGYTDWVNNGDAVQAVEAPGADTDTTRWVKGEQVVVPEDDTYTDWTEWATTQSGLSAKPEIPANTDVHEWRVVGPVVVSEGKPGSVIYYAWTDGKECDTNTPTPTPSPSTNPSPSVTPTTPLVTPPSKSTPTTGGYVWPHTGA